MAKNKGKYQFHQFVKASLRGTTKISSQTSTLQYIYIYINDLFYTTWANVCNYADDTTFHICDSDLENLINRLEHDSVLAIE